MGETLLILIRLTILILSLYALLKYRSLSVELGYCDSGRSSNALLDQRAAEYAQLSQSPDEADAIYAFLPIPMHCTPCPQYAACAQGAIEACEPEFLLTDSLLAHIPFSGVFDGMPYIGPVAFPQRCEPDSEKRAMAADVAVHVLSTLEKHRGDVTCGGVRRRRGLSDNDAYALGEDDVYAFISALKDVSCLVLVKTASYVTKKSISQVEFDEIWKLAVKDLVDNEEIDFLVKDSG